MRLAFGEEVQGITDYEDVIAGSLTGVVQDLVGDVFGPFLVFEGVAKDSAVLAPESFHLEGVR